MSDTGSTTKQSQAPPRPRLLCLTITGYRRPGLSEQECRDFMTRVHAPLAAELMAEYGIERYAMRADDATAQQTHNDSQTRPLLYALDDAEFSNLSDYDFVVQFVFRDVADLKRMKADARFLEKLAPDHVRFADMRKTT
ncbi:Dimeric alpha-beta barrel [Moelleriella libera RCEF 2490]|uniref:Dimeric alpha-beta barrel n=1 Tax=Moelleriella libera RCEF 2490 TaxID=1081109 RepID=A0A167W740_9HYPO|nr:Dimeric alpha-beta barrel [Moelleriella libera RCEF 2490]